MIDYYSTIKRNALLTYRVAWMSLKISRQSERGQTKKKECILYASFYMTFWERKNIEIKIDHWLPAVGVSGRV